MLETAEQAVSSHEIQVVLLASDGSYSGVFEVLSGLLPASGVSCPISQ